MRNKILNILFIFGFAFWCKIVFIPIWFIFELVNNGWLLNTLNMILDYSLLVMAILTSLGVLISSRVKKFVEKIYNKLPNVRNYFIAISWIMILPFLGDVKIYLPFAVIFSIICAIIFDKSMNFNKKIVLIILLLMAMFFITLGELIYNF